MNCRKFPKFPYRGGKFSKVGNYCGNLSLPSGNLLVLDLVTLKTSLVTDESKSTDDILYSQTIRLDVVTFHS